MIVDVNVDVDVDAPPVSRPWLEVHGLAHGRRMVQLNPSPDLDDPVRGTNTVAVVLIDEVDRVQFPPCSGRTRLVPVPVPGHRSS